MALQRPREGCLLDRRTLQTRQGCICSVILQCYICWRALKPLAMVILVRYQGWKWQSDYLVDHGTFHTISRIFSNQSLFYIIYIAFNVDLYRAFEIKKEVWMRLCRRVLDGQWSKPWPSMLMWEGEEEHVQSCRKLFYLVVLTVTTKWVLNSEWSCISPI